VLRPLLPHFQSQFAVALPANETARIHSSLPPVLHPAGLANQLVPVGQRLTALAYRLTVPASPYLPEQLLKIPIPVPVAFSLQVQVVMTQFVFDDADQLVRSMLLQMKRIQFQVMAFQQVTAARGSKPPVETDPVQKRPAETGQGYLFHQPLQLLVGHLLLPASTLEFSLKNTLHWSKKATVWRTSMRYLLLKQQDELQIVVMPDSYMYQLVALLKRLHKEVGKLTSADRPELPEVIAECGQMELHSDRLSIVDGLDYVSLLEREFARLKETEYPLISLLTEIRALQAQLEFLKEEELE
jgi:hypothetical protein